LLKAIQLVLTGEKFIPIDRNTNNIMPSFYGTSSTARPMLGGDVEQRLADLQLTRRERDVLAHLASGASNKEIANHLGLQIVTVKLHVRGLCRKLNAKNRTQVALRARELGLAG
jgi:DNA-binding NarL/FixJ family response regulator